MDRDKSMEMSTDLCEVEDKMREVNTKIERHKSEVSLRRSQRTRKPSYKAKEAMEQEYDSRLSRFQRVCNDFKMQLRTIREKAKVKSGEKEYDILVNCILTSLKGVQRVYDELQETCDSLPREVVHQMDIANVRAQDLQKVLQELSYYDIEEGNEKTQLLKRPLIPEYAKSVYGSTISRLSRTSEVPSVVDLQAKKLELKAELASKEKEIELNQQIGQLQLQLESLKDLKELKILQTKIQVLSSTETIEDEESDEDMLDGPIDVFKINENMKPVHTLHRLPNVHFRTPMSSGTGSDTTFLKSRVQVPKDDPRRQVGPSAIPFSTPYNSPQLSAATHLPSYSADTGGSSIHKNKSTTSVLASNTHTSSGWSSNQPGVTFTSNVHSNVMMPSSIYSAAPVSRNTTTTPAVLQMPNFQDQSSNTQSALYSAGANFPASSQQQSAPMYYEPVTPMSPMYSSPSSNISPETAAIAQVLSESVQRSRLPAPVPKVFDGDPLSYLSFKMSFQTLIGTKQISASEKLYYLQQYVSGPAYECISGFFFGNSEEAYLRAWTTLESRFGHPFVIQQAYRTKLEKWPRVSSKDALSFQKFADYLKSCLDATPYIPGLTVLNDCIENQRLLQKLPDWCVRSWNRLVTDHMDLGNPYPSFADFVTFLQREARVATNPISSLQSLRDPKQNTEYKEKPKQRKVGTYATALSENKDNSTQQNDQHQRESNGKEQTGKKSYPCPVCMSLDHKVWNCPTFKDKSLDEKKKTILNKKMCFRCLFVGHSAKDCRSSLRCSECRRKHHTLIHEDLPPNNDSSARNKSTKSTGASEIQSGDEEDQVEEDTAVTHRISAKSPSPTAIKTSIVPVLASSCGGPEILVYAMIDSQSDCSYISHDLMDKLHIAGTPVKLTLSTLISTTQITCSKVSDVVIRGLDSQERIRVNSCYSRDYIPYNEDQIPTRDSICSNPHLKKIEEHLQPLLNCDVGLLLGADVPQAQAPVEFYTPIKSASFAVKTDLGWSIVGGGTSVKDTFCHRTAARESPLPVPKDVLSVLESDFSEKETGSKPLSIEDSRFLHQLNEDIHFGEKGYIEMPLPLKGSVLLPNNRKMALVRLNHLKHKMAKDPNYKVKYIQFMEDIEKLGSEIQASMTRVNQREKLLNSGDLYRRLFSLFLQIRKLSENPCGLAELFSSTQI